MEIDLHGWFLSGNVFRSACQTIITTTKIISLKTTTRQSQ